MVLLQALCFLALYDRVQNTFPHWAFVSSLENDLRKISMHSRCTCAFISSMFSLDSISATPPVPNAETGDGKDKGRRMLGLLFPLVHDKGWARGIEPLGEVWTCRPKSPGGKLAPAARVSGFTASRGVPRSRKMDPKHHRGRCAPREMPGWGRGSQGSVLGRQKPLGATPAGAAGRPISPCWGGAEPPRVDTHRTSVLLQRHQLAPDVDSLEVVEVLLPRCAGRSRQEQPRCHQCSHHDLLPRWPICQGKDEAGEGRVWGGILRWGREEAAPASPGQRRRTRPFLFLLGGRWRARHWTSVSPSLLQEPFDSAPLPGPHSQGSRILITETRI